VTAILRALRTCSREEAISLRAGVFCFLNENLANLREGLFAHLSELIEHVYAGFKIEDILFIKYQECPLEIIRQVFEMLWAEERLAGPLSHQFFVQTLDALLSYF
jgi:hypothetical protein